MLEMPAPAPTSDGPSWASSFGMTKHPRQPNCPKGRKRELGKWMEMIHLPTGASRRSVVVEIGHGGLILCCGGLILMRIAARWPPRVSTSPVLTFGSSPGARWQRSRQVSRKTNHSWKASRWLPAPTGWRHAVTLGLDLAQSWCGPRQERP